MDCKVEWITSRWTKVSGDDSYSNLSQLMSENKIFNTLVTIFDFFLKYFNLVLLVQTPLFISRKEVQIVILCVEKNTKARLFSVFVTSASTSMETMQIKM